jgi:hypothetical protein
LSSVVVQQSGIRAARWDPAGHRLAICTGNNKLYLWTPDGCAIVDVMPGTTPQRRTQPHT